MVVVGLLAVELAQVRFRKFRRISMTEGIRVKGKNSMSWLAVVD